MRTATLRPGLGGPVLIGLGVALATLAGALLWWRHGEAVFTTYLTAALAWCF